MSTLTLRQTSVLVVIFLVTSLIFIALDRRNALDPVKTGLYDLVQPVTSAIYDLADGPGADSELEQQLAEAQAEIDRLRAENVKLEGLEKENAQLRDQLGVASANPDWTTINANVLAGDPASLQKFLTIDRGSSDGIKNGMAVVAPNSALAEGDDEATAFLVGLITEVSETSARVTLVIDDSFRVGARLAETGADGTLYGAWGQGGRCVLRNLDAGIQPVESEWVVTSGGETKTVGVPDGLIIGQIEGTISGDPQNQEVEIPVLPYVNFEALQVVTVVMADGS